VAYHDDRSTKSCCEESGSIEWIAGHQVVIWMAGMKNDMLRSGVKEDVFFEKPLGSFKSKTQAMKQDQMHHLQ